MLRNLEISWIDMGGHHHIHRWEYLEPIGKYRLPSKGELVRWLEGDDHKQRRVTDVIFDLPRETIILACGQEGDTA